MIPPVPVESLPQWVQDKLKEPIETFAVGDRVFGVLYNEPDGTVLYINNEEGFARVGWDFNPKTKKYNKQAMGAIYYVKH